MADEKKPSGSKKRLTEDRLVERLVPQPSNTPPNVTVFVGFLGRSPKEEYWRVYLTRELNEFVEVAEADVVNTESLATEQNPEGGTRVWIKSGANVQHFRIDSRQIQAEFLKGTIMTGFFKPGIGFSETSPGVGLPQLRTGTPCTDEYNTACCDTKHGLQHWSDRGYCYSGGGTFCTWGQPCTQKIITCTENVQAVVHKTQAVVCTPREG